jgi:hypothetical protein
VKTTNFIQILTSYVLVEKSERKKQLGRCRFGIFEDGFQINRKREFG